jgi:hypothetical protein
MVARTSDPNTGHGHVRRRPDGVKARCGGPGMCTECSRELAQMEAQQRAVAAQGSSNPCNVPETLRSIVREGNAWPSAGIISEAANLLDDADTLLGRLAECFGDDETEFADIKLMRDRIADVDTRARHDSTDDSARAHGNETGEGAPETLVVWVAADYWRCRCKPPGDINHGNSYQCRDCGTIRPEQVTALKANEEWCTCRDVLVRAGKCTECGRPLRLRQGGSA